MQKASGIINRTDTNRRRASITAILNNQRRTIEHTNSERKKTHTHTNPNRIEGARSTLYIHTKYIRWADASNITPIPPPVTYPKPAATSPHKKEKEKCAYYMLTLKPLTNPLLHTSAVRPCSQHYTTVCSMHACDMCIYAACIPINVVLACVFTYSHVHDTRTHIHTHWHVLMSMSLALRAVACLQASMRACSIRVVRSCKWVAGWMGGSFRNKTKTIRKCTKQKWRKQIGTEKLWWNSYS